MRVALSVVLVGVALAQLALAQDQTTPKLSWKERAKLDYQRRYEKYILHKQVDDENTIEGGSGSESSNVIPLGTRIGLSPPPPPVVVTRPPPPPTTTASWRLPPPSTTPYRPPPPPPTTTTTPRPPPPSTTSRPPPPPPTPFRPLPTTTRPPPPPTRPAPRPTTTNIRRTTEAPVVVPDVGLRGAFGDDDAPVSPEAAAAPAVLSAPAAAPAAVPAVLPAPAAAGTASGGVPAFGEGQGTMSGTFQGRPAGLPANTGFASSSATAFSSGGVAGGSSASTAGTTNAGGAATGTFTVSVGGGGSASASTTGAVSKSPVALLGKVVQGIVRPITAILPAPLGPRGSNPGLIGGLVSGGFEVLDGSIRAIYPGTLWCGAGNVARSEDDVGVFRSTDQCCRQHDNCPDSIAAGASKHGLRNTGTFTRSHCDCDEAFYNCLKADRKSIVSVKVGTTYFNLLRPRCFRPVNSCTGGGSNCTSTYRWLNNRFF